MALGDTGNRAWMSIAEMMRDPMATVKKNTLVNTLAAVWERNMETLTDSFSWFGPPLITHCQFRHGRGSFCYTAYYENTL